MNSSFEFLESRQLLSAGVKHLHQTAPSGNWPRRATTSRRRWPVRRLLRGHIRQVQLRTAYGFNDLSLPNVSGDGAGQTIAIIDAYDDPNFVNTGSASFTSSDLHKFDTTFGLQDPPSFIKVNRNRRHNAARAEHRMGR